MAGWFDNFFKKSINEFVFNLKNIICLHYHLLVTARNNFQMVKLKVYNPEHLPKLAPWNTTI